MPRVKPNAAQLSDVYIDESSQTQHRYLGLGGLIINTLDVPTFETALAGARLPDLPLRGELRWTKVSATKLAAYTRVVDLFFDRIAGVAPLEFHSLIVDTTRLKDRIYNKGSREIGFNKEVYQLCQKFRRNYKYRLFHVYPDARKTSSRPEDLRFMLNRGAANAGDPRDWPFRRLHPRDSKLTPALQLTDVLLGAVMFKINGHDLHANASPAKTALSAHVLQRANIRYPMVSTNRMGRFTIWHRDLD
jgi:hypothetical protein